MGRTAEMAFMAQSSRPPTLISTSNASLVPKQPHTKSQAIPLQQWKKLLTFIVCFLKPLKCHNFLNSYHIDNIQTLLNSFIQLLFVTLVLLEKRKEKKKIFIWLYRPYIELLYSNLPLNNCMMTMSIKKKNLEMANLYRHYHTNSTACLYYPDTLKTEILF